MDPMLNTGKAERADGGGSSPSVPLRRLDALPECLIDWALQSGNSGIPLVLFRLGDRIFLRSGGAHALASIQFLRELEAAGVEDVPETIGSGWTRRNGAKADLWPCSPPTEKRTDTLGPFDLNRVRDLILRSEAGLEITPDFTWLDEAK